MNKSFTEFVLTENTTWMKVDTESRGAVQHQHGFSHFGWASYADRAAQRPGSGTFSSTELAALPACRTNYLQYDKSKPISSPQPAKDCHCDFRHVDKDEKLKELKESNLKKNAQVFVMWYTRRRL